jgi:hypothetical protein
VEHVERRASSASSGSRIRSSRNVHRVLDVP